MKVTFLRIPRSEASTKSVRRLMKESSPLDPRKHTRQQGTRCVYYVSRVPVFKRGLGSIYLWHNWDLDSLLIFFHPKYIHHVRINLVEIFKTRIFYFSFDTVTDRWDRKVQTISRGRQLMMNQGAKDEDSGNEGLSNVEGSGTPFDVGVVCATDFYRRDE